MTRARLSFLALFLIALFKVKTVNLAQLSTGFMGSAKTETSAGLLPHRLQRRLECIRVREDYRDFCEKKIVKLRYQSFYSYHCSRSYFLFENCGVF